MAKFPDFIIIGSMKCGTTAMWRNMNMHPSITMCKNPHDPKKTSTEIRFWTNSAPYHNFDKGIDWYKSLFSGGCCGEKDADLIRSKKAMELISKHIPNVKLILTVRNPVDRAYSEFQMSVGGDLKSFEKMMSKKKGYWERGRYYERIKNRVLPFFSPSQIFVSPFEWMKQNTNKELNRVYDFLGVENVELPVKDIKFKKRDSKVNSYRNWSSNYKPLKGDLRRKLLAEYKYENEKLFIFMGQRIFEWGT
jgi:hypothetical protein